MWLKEWTGQWADFKARWLKAQQERSDRIDLGVASSLDAEREFCRLEQMEHELLFSLVDEVARDISPKEARKAARLVVAFTDEKCRFFRERDGERRRRSEQMAELAPSPCGAAP